MNCNICDKYKSFHEQNYVTIHIKASGYGEHKIPLEVCDKCLKMALNGWKNLLQLLRVPYLGPGSKKEVK